MLGQITPRTLLTVVYDRTPSVLRRLVRGNRQGSGSGAETLDFRYCQGVWLNHLGNAFSSGFDRFPRTVGEIGPGQSLGVGLAALITGADHYAAFDAVNLLRLPGHLEMFDQLVESFKDPAAWAPAGSPAILTQEHQTLALATDRLAKIRSDIKKMGSGQEGSSISYTCPWSSTGFGESGSIDLMISQASLMYVPDLGHLYREIERTLSPHGRSSNKVDHSSVGGAKDWDGHWAISKSLWNLISSRRPYSINRAPYSEHIRRAEESGLTVARLETNTRPPSFGRDRLAKEYRNISDQDRETFASYFCLRKRG